MIIKIKNITAHPQEVMFCDGSGKIVLPGQALDIEEGKVYKEELVRIERFFETIPVKKRKPYKRKIKTLSSKNNDGGTV